ncbi:hypothetical protein [Streptomyces sp. NBC_01643]|uniref:hypothetical protein n=1 Tax=Streptomyces sp. NBC_01643 TaxID=2975906 RepID=UPI003869A19E|nr:hypothetical protein OHB03_21745 [Streptomyces sp. NBC_01643]
MIETVPWEEVAANPDKYVQLAEEKEAEMQRDIYKLRQELRLLRTMKKQKEIVDEWRESGIPEQRQPETGDDAEATASGGSQPLTRKMRIMRLMAQDPQRRWKALEVANALDEASKIKSVRVAMDELSRAEYLTKLPHAFYQYVQSQQA